jgi:hypothetical protein
VEGDHVQALLIEAGQDLVQGDSDAIPVALPGVAVSGVVDQDLAHRLGRGREEIAAVGDIGEGVAVEQPQQGLVDQGAGLEAVARPLAAHQAAGHPPQLAVDGPDEPLPGVRDAGAGLVEDGRQVTRSFGAHFSPNLPRWVRNYFNNRAKSWNSLGFRGRPRFLK